MTSVPNPLRRDLVVSRQETTNGIMYVIKDPVNGRFFRFRDVEYTITRLLDGEHTHEQIRKAVEEQYDAPLEQATLDAFIRQLTEYGLMDHGQPVIAAEKPLWNARTPYTVRFRLYNPDKLLDRMVGPLGFLFTPMFVIAAALLIAWAAVSSVLDGGQIISDFRHMHLVWAVALAWLSVIVVGAMHEFAHGLTCKHFGGEVRDMGFLLIYFHPALYCNVSDTWLFQEKWKRLCVMFAGTFLELSLWAIALLAWRFTETGTLPNMLALVVIGTSGAKVLLNFNPLIKLDGYYILTDLLDIPNLRRKSFLHIRRRIGLARKEDESAVTPRERRVFLAYGLIASAFTIGLLVFVSYKVGNFLMGRYQAWGLLLFLLFVPFIFRYRLRRLLPGAPLPVEPKSGIKAFSANRGWIAAGAAGVILVLLVGWMDLRVTGDFSVLPVHNADIRAEVDGIVADVLVTEGQIVRKGQTLAHLSAREYSSDLEKTGADLEEAAARYELQRRGRRPEEIELARKELETATARRDHAITELAVKGKVRGDEVVKARSSVALCEERLKYAQNNMDRAKKLADQQVISPKEFETVAEQTAVRRREYETALADMQALQDDDLASARRELALSEGSLKESDQRLRLLTAGTRPEELDATEAQVNRLEAQRRYLEDQVTRTTIVSPIDGTVTTPERELREMAGQYVGKGDLIAEVHDVRSVTVEIAVPEKEIEDVHIGQQVRLKARAYPDRVFTGQVTAIASTARGGVPNNSSRETERARDRGTANRELIVRTRIPNPEFLLKPDMTGKAKIVCGRRSLFNLMTRRLARAVRVEFWSWW